MLIVSDTSPVTNLLRIEHLNLLYQVFGVVILPQAVYDELCQLPQQKEVIDQQNWIFVQKPENHKMVFELETDLDEGEAEAIVLAIELKADFLIIDELKGRSKAEEAGLKIIGLLGVLLRAKQAGFLPAVKPLIDQLIAETGFRVHASLYQRVLKIAGE